MVNKFTRTLLRQGIAMVTDQKSLGARKVSISGGSGREGEVGALGMLLQCRSLTGVPSRTRASHRTLGTRGHGLCPSVPPSLLRRDPADLSTELSEAEHTGVPSLAGFSLRRQLGSSLQSVLDVLCSLTTVAAL